MANLSLLLVDDEPDVLKVMKKRIEDWGFAVIEAANGREAMNSLISKNIDIVVLDHALPDMTGLDVLKEIHKIDRRIPVVLFTAYADEKMRQSAKKLGAAAVIPKISASEDVQDDLKSTLETIKKNMETIRGG